jgi:hypothetical protein
MEMTIAELFELVHILIVDPAAGDAHEPEPEADPTPPRGISRERLEQLTDDYLNDLVCWVRANGGMGQFAPHVVAMATLHACFTRLYRDEDFGDLCTDAELALHIRDTFTDAVRGVADKAVPL